MGKKRLLMLVVVLTVALLAATAAAAPYWEAVIRHPERATRPYSEYTYYSELPLILREIEQSSNRVKIEVIGQSVWGYDMFLAVVSDPQTHGRLGRYAALRNAMLRDPARAQRMLEQGADFKVPIFINAGIHGNEQPATDAALRMLRTLAFEDTEEVRGVVSFCDPINSN